MNHKLSQSSGLKVELGLGPEWSKDIRVVHELGQPTGCVGLSWIFYFWWMGLGHGSETVEGACLL